MEQVGDLAGSEHISRGEWPSERLLELDMSAQGIRC